MGKNTLCCRGKAVQGFYQLSIYSLLLSSGSATVISHHHFTTFSSAFRERLHQMDRTRIQRLSLLQVQFDSPPHFHYFPLQFPTTVLRSESSFPTIQAEKELQADKSRALASKLANISASEQRCSWLDHKIAS